MRQSGVARAVLHKSVELDIIPPPLFVLWLTGGWYLFKICV